MFAGATLIVVLIAMWFLGGRTGLLMGATFLTAALWGRRTKSAGWD